MWQEVLVFHLNTSYWVSVPQTYLYLLTTVLANDYLLFR